MQIRANHPDLLTPAMDKIFFDTYLALPIQYQDFLHVRMGEQKSEEKHSTITGIDPVAETEERDPTPQADPVQGFDKTYVFRTFRGGYGVSWEQKQDDLHFISGRRMATTLSKSHRNAEEIDGANIFNNAESDTGPDQKSLLSLTHPNEYTGASWANRPTNHVDLSTDALEKSIQRLNLIEDPTGFPIVLTSWKLVIHPDNKFNAQRILNSVLDPNSANNAVNPLEKEDVKIALAHYFTDKDAWFVEAEQHMLNFLWRWKPEFNSDNVFNNNDTLYDVKSRFDTGYSSPRGVDGSTGN